MDTFPSLPEMTPVPPSPRFTPPVRDWRYWLRRLLVCNPFFLVSAALLLFAVNRLSVDPEFLGSEEPKLLFNFGTLQFYGILLAATAVALARRRIWYDSALLVVLEHGLVLVPFMLISQAALIGSGLAWTLVLAGATAAVLRAVAIRRGYPHFNLPVRTLAVGAVVLTANVALPLWFRSVVTATSVVDWPGPNRFVWLVALPALTALANLTPRPSGYSPHQAARSWLPLLIVGLWLAGSAVHAWSVAYLGKDVEMSAGLFAPLTAVILWTLWNRLGDFQADPPLPAQQALLGMALLTPLLAFREAGVLLVVGGLNFAGFLALWWWRRDALGRWAGKLALATLPLLLAAVPPSWLERVPGSLTRGELCVMGLGAFALIASWLSRRPLVAAAGSVALVVGLDLAGLGLPTPFLWQLGCLTLLCHSLRWTEDDAVARRLRKSVAGLWILLELVPTHHGWLDLGWAQGLSLTLAWAAFWWLTRRRPAWAIAVVAAVMTVLQPLLWSLEHASLGILALLGSFAMFAAGALFAWRRRHPELAGEVRGLQERS